MLTSTFKSGTVTSSDTWPNTYCYAFDGNGLYWPEAFTSSMEESEETIGTDWDYKEFIHSSIYLFRPYD
jgi:hypothetical protein